MLYIWLIVTVPLVWDISIRWYLVIQIRYPKKSINEESILLNSDYDDES